MTGWGRWWKTLVSRYEWPKFDIEFPTAAPIPWKSPTARFPHFHSADDRFIYFNQANQTKVHALRAFLPKRLTKRRFPSLLAILVQDHLVLESKSRFSIILRLENADRTVMPERFKQQTPGYPWTG